MSGRLRTLRNRVGRRGAALCFFAFLDLVYAGGILTAPPTATYVFLGGILPLPVWAAIWAGVGAVCGVGAFTRRDRAAFAAASLIKVGWGSLHLVGWALGMLPRGFVAAAVWLAAAALVQVIAGWPEPRRGP